MLGTSMWYALYGDALTSESVFEGRMDALCRELGDRGRADAIDVPDDRDPLANVGQQSADSNAAVAVPLHVAAPVELAYEDLQQLKLGALVRYAVAQNIDAAALDEAEDSDDPHAAIITLLLPQRFESAAASEQTDEVLVSLRDTLRAELSGLRYMSLVRRAIEAGVDQEAMEGADEADDSTSALVELIILKEAQ
jgi:hypothetical protein